MNNQSEASYLQQCLQLIEAKLSWGPPDDWSQYDFEKLSEQISHDTGVRLSISTLKRLWGKVAYNNVPALNTLNTLARYIGHEDWRSFKLGVQPAKVHPVQETPAIPGAAASEAPVKQHPGSGQAGWYWLLMLIPLAVTVYALTGLTRRSTALNPDHFRFSANKMVTSGLPNSVVFSYDASAAQTDSVYIVQTWDISRKTLVPRKGHEHSAIYYYPGYFRTKLIADGQIIKTHDLMIGTNGWLVLAEGGPPPLYFKKEEFDKGQYLEIDKSILGSYNLPLHPEPPRVRFFNLQEMGALMNDNFVFETTLRSGFNEGSAACQGVEVLIQCKDDIIIIPLVARSCVGDIGVYACGKGLHSKEADLSKFGCDLSQWTTLKVESINKHMTFYVNDTAACSFTFPHNPTGVVGVQYRFRGPGAVKAAKFSGNGVVYKL